MRKPILALILVLALGFAANNAVSAQGPAVPPGNPTFNGVDLNHTPGIAFKTVKTITRSKQLPSATTHTSGPSPLAATDGAGNWLYTSSVIGYYYYSNTGRYVCTYGYAQAWTSTAAYVTVGDGLFLNGQEVFWGYGSSSGYSGYAVETTGCYVQPYWTQGFNEAYSSAYFLNTGRQANDSAINYWFRSVQ